MRLLPLCVILASMAAVTSAFDVPCSEKLFGGACAHDGECYGDHMYCNEDTCACLEGFEPAYATGTNTTKLCRPAPSRVGDACFTKCKAPLLCVRDADSELGKCACEDGTVDSRGECRVPCPAGRVLRGYACVTPPKAINADCEDDDDCESPFAKCSPVVVTTGRGRAARQRTVPGKKTCQCQEGSVYDATERACVGKCPDGARASRSCKRLFLNDVDLLEHEENGDSCAKNEYCATYGSPNVGHCCKLRCPLGEPDLSQTCDAGARGQCRDLTHFCHTVKSEGYSVSMCCPRPCREPMPLYIDGACRRRAEFGDECTSDEQCDGGATMRCASKKCRCRPGHVFAKQSAGSLLPTCVKLCEEGETAYAHRCLAASSIGGACAHTVQCPSGAQCRKGSCVCDCGLSASQGVCKDPNASVLPGGGDLIQPLLGILGGNGGTLGK